MESWSDNSYLSEKSSKGSYGFQLFDSGLAELNQESSSRSPISVAKSRSFDIGKSTKLNSEGKKCLIEALADMPTMKSLSFAEPASISRSDSMSTCVSAGELIHSYSMELELGMATYREYSTASVDEVCRIDQEDDNNYSEDEDVVDVSYVNDFDGHNSDREHLTLIQKEKVAESNNLIDSTPPEAKLLHEITAEVQPKFPAPASFTISMKSLKHRAAAFGANLNWDDHLPVQLKQQTTSPLDLLRSRYRQEFIQDQERMCSKILSV